MAEEEKDGLLLRLPDNLMISIPSLSLARAIDTARVCCDLLNLHRSSLHFSEADEMVSLLQELRPIPPLSLTP